MKLHNNKDAFERLIRLVSDYYKIDPALVEKDYFVTLLLKELAARVPSLLFKGGTSLSKCHKIIDRFSEDIDLTLDENHQTQGQKKQMKAELVEACETLGLHLTNFEEIRSRRDYNCYKIEYPIQHLSVSIKPLLLVETTYITKAYPSELRPATSIIYDYLKEMGNDTAIEKYELQPFEIRVQTLDRTLVDKVFAVCDYLVGERIERNSRHIYDLARLLTRVNLDEKLKELVKDVRADRKPHALCYSAQDDANVPGMLAEIVKSGIYKEDYETITRIMMFKYLPYEEAIKALETIIASGVFEK
ncbi:MAG: nucleotidyl transferase AbiEii/AbiGii toxin family protein [Clostridia bacterium]|nr:nucleotidyl transferase AbiEii/AbiGii toxin family protein [Clostridia bacterium]